MRKVIIKTDSVHNLDGTPNNLIIVDGFIWHKLPEDLAHYLWLKDHQIFAVYSDCTESEVGGDDWLEVMETYKVGMSNFLGFCLEGGYVDQALDLGTSAGDSNCIKAIENEKSVSFIWSIQDVHFAIESADIQFNGITVELSDEEALGVLNKCKATHDATIGMNWDVLEEAILEYLEERESC